MLRDTACVLHCVERYFFVLHSVEWYCVFTAQCREVLCVYGTVKLVNVCVLHSVVGHSVYTVQCREALCVYFTV